jgi:CheY-like chemotaxis protein
MVVDSVAPPVVLIVEDEMFLRMRAVDIVEDAGYTSVEAVDADEAVEILESRSDIALLFTDIQMPGSMDGLKLAHAVHDRWPPIKIILVSGQLKLSKTDIPADSRFFGKPLEAKEMIAEIKGNDRIVRRPVSARNFQAVESAFGAICTKPDRS